MADGSENQFGKYELQARIAVGGMAEIFKARFAPAPGVTKQVVIKRILPHYAANKGFIQMFTNEAKIALGLSHGNIAQVFDFGEIDGDWFLAMELVDGQPLSKVLKRGRTLGIAVMPTPFAVAIGIELLRGLHYAHTRLDEQGRPLKIVHRDVSPQNVLVSYEGQVKIVDFGIAKARNAGSEETEAGAFKGKYAYFAPEQARGKELDARTDIFAAGIVMYEMLCGQLPFQGKMIEVLSKIVRGEFPPPREHNPQITPALERILLKAMAHEKSERYQTAEEFQEALSAYLAQTAPTFAASGLALFMGLLFEEERVAEGRPVQLPREFLDQVATWRGAMPPLPPRPTLSLEAAVPTPSAGRKSKKQLQLEAELGQENPTGMHFTAAPALPGWSRPLLFTSIPLIAALLTAIGVLAWGRWSTFSIQLTSNPSHAELRLDGQLRSETTPVRLGGLAANRAHELELSAPGMKPWVQRVEPRRGEVLAVNAELEAVPVAAPVEDAGVGVAAPELPPLPPPLPPVPTSADFPVDRVTLEAKTHAFLVPASKAARLRLDPKKSYRVWTEGKISFGGAADKRSVNEAVFFLDGTPALLARDSFGAVGPKGAVVKNASAIYAFVADGTSSDNSGSMRLRVMELGSHATSTVMIDSHSNAFTPEAGDRFSIQQLDPLATYELKLKEPRGSARTHGVKGGPVRKVLLKSGNDAQRILEVGKPLRVTGVRALWVSFPDESLEDNDGSLDLLISPVKILAPKGSTGSGL